MRLEEFKALKERVLSIFNHFGEDNQMDKLREELEEFLDTVMAKDKTGMEEELADILLVLFQFSVSNKLNTQVIERHLLDKLDRTEYRIQVGYYE